MSVRSLLWRLASPYDAYIAHVSMLESALEQIRYLVQRALAYEAGIHGSVRLIPGGAAAEARAARFRERVSSAATGMTDEQFELFLADLGGGASGSVEEDRARAFERMTGVTAALERHLSTAARELTTLEERDYNPASPALARMLRDNGFPPRTVADYRHLLRDLGAQVGQRPS